MDCKPYCHNLLAATSKVVLFDHPVGDGEQHRRHLIPSIRAVCRMLYRADAADEFAHGWPGSSSCRELIKGLPPREKRQWNCRMASTRRCVKRRVRITSRSAHVRNGSTAASPRRRKRVCFTSKSCRAGHRCYGQFELNFPASASCSITSHRRSARRCSNDGGCCGALWRSLRRRARQH